MKIALCLIVLGLLVGCTTANQAIQHIDADLLQTADTIWAQKDCRGGVIQAITEARQVKSIVADKVQAFGDPKSETYQRCYYLALVTDLYLRTVDSIVPDILGIPARIR